jgi:alkylation response protein AidB-like acyl-CoA dehydrogenase
MAASSIMQLTLSPQDEAFRDEVRAFLDAKFTPDLRADSARQAGVFAEPDLARRWQRILFERGWVAPAWPQEHGGTGWSPVQRYIYDTECADAGTPVLPALGLQMCGPVLIGYGTPEQKAWHLPRILSGENYWCQGYSEPQAGSDLASLQCRAVRDGDDYVVNGTKIWTTHAHAANWIFLLVRTDPAAKPQAGISFLLVPMASKGITVRPILSMSGQHDVNQVFFDDVRVPVANRVGAENQGWTVAKYLLEFERGGGSAAVKVRRALKLARAVAAGQRNDVSVPLVQDPDFAARAANVEIQLRALEATERRVISGLSTGRPVGNAIASMLKLRGSELTQKATELGVEALGPYAAPDQTEALRGAIQAEIGPARATVPVAYYLNMRASTVFGGCAEVQRDILARAAVGL